MLGRVLPLLALSAAAADLPTAALKIPRIARPPTLEDFLDMKPGPGVENHMARVDAFLQRDPSDGKPVSQRTEAYFAYDDKNLYAVFVCFDSDPKKIRARMGRRESIFGDDLVAVFFDTFHDRQRAYEFIVNPLGIQMDGIISEGQGDDFSFDTLWHSAGRLTGQGYVVWIAIPFKSLRFPHQAAQTWGIGAMRLIPRNNEQSFWPYNSRKVEGFTQQLATADGLADISPGRNVQLIPYGIFSGSRFLDTRGAPMFRGQNEQRIGLDAKVVLRQSLSLDIAVNPDFSQVESDEPQVTVNQRFEVFFPEKRPFFIENAAFFRTPINLFFSRRIADPSFGTRLTGKLGRWAVGALVADDRAPGSRVADEDPASGERAYFTVARVTRELGKQSSVGMIFTDREFLGGFNRVGGIDGRWKVNKNWVANVQAVTSSTRQSDGTYRAGNALVAEAYRSGRKLNYFGAYNDFTPGFRTEAGFLERSDIRRVQQNVNYRFRPEGKRLVSWGPHMYYERVWDHGGTRLDSSSFNDIIWEFRRETFVGVLCNFFRERLRPKDFPVLAQPVDFSKRQPGFLFGSNYFRQISIEGLVRWGTRTNFVPPAGQEPYLATGSAGNVSLTLRPISPLRIDNTWIFQRYRERGPAGANIFNNHILRSKWNWQFNRELSLRAIVQYETVLVNPERTSLQTRKNVNADFLITYLLHPGTAVYVGYNSNLQNLDPELALTDGGLRRTPRRFINDGRQFFAKVSYLFRF